MKKALSLLLIVAVVFSVGMLSSCGSERKPREMMSETSTKKEYGRDQTVSSDAWTTTARPDQTSTDASTAAWSSTTTAPTPTTTTTRPAPTTTTTTTRPAPTTTTTTTRPSPSTTRPAPTTTKPAPTTTKPAPTTTKPAPSTTNPPAHSWDEFYERLCADTWLAADEDMDNTMTVRFLQNGTMRETTRYNGETHTADLRLNESETAKKNCLVFGGWDDYDYVLIRDLGSDDLVQFDSEGGENSSYRVLIRKSAYDKNSRLEKTILKSVNLNDKLSSWIAGKGVRLVTPGSVKLKSLNQRTVLLVYSADNGEQKIRAVLTLASGETALDAYVVVTNECDGVEFVDEWYAGRWKIS